MRSRRLSPALLLVLAACAMSDDPAAGGFYSGVAGLAGGGYDARIADREAAVATSRAEAARLEGELSSLQSRLAAQRAALRSEGVRLSPATEARFDAAMRGAPAGGDPSVRAESLRTAIADARRLSEQLAQLGSTPLPG